MLLREGLKGLGSVLVVSSVAHNMGGKRVYWTKRRKAESWLAKEREYGGSAITGIMKLFEMIDMYSEIVKGLREKKC